MVSFLKRIINNLLSFIIRQWRSHGRVSFVNIRLTKLSKKVEIYIISYFRPTD